MEMVNLYTQIRSHLFCVDGVCPFCAVDLYGQKRIRLSCAELSKKCRVSILPSMELTSEVEPNVTTDLITLTTLSITE